MVFVFFLLKINFLMATTDRKRKRETNEEENTTTMETEQSSSAQFPQINPSQLEVKLEFKE